ncbi:MAG: hypothetical protein NVS3B20_11680 [Polyangiales bacterium]
MADVLDLDTLWSARNELGEGEVRSLSIARVPKLEVKFHVTRCGTWPKKADEDEESYVVVRGEIQFETDAGPMMVRAGQMITFAAGEKHGATIREGAISIGVHHRAR